MITYKVSSTCYLLVFATTLINGQLHEKYVGCFKENEVDQRWALALNNGNDLTVEICIQECYKLNTTFAALPNGRRCSCINNPGQQMHDSNCNVRCSGGRLQICGGDQTTKMYSLYTVCRVGYFGPNCDQFCRCRTHLPCDRKTGICPDGCEEEGTGANSNTTRTLLRQYVGCYKDNQTRAMELSFLEPITRNNTIESCIGICASRNKAYAGMQYSYECFCGNSYDRYGPLPESRCNMTCSGNNKQICGGVHSLSVHRVNDRLRCLRDTDCNWNEVCDIIDLNYMNVSRCRCKQGYHKMGVWRYCIDIDECNSNNSKCNATTENCINNNGSYRCECKSGFSNVSGNCEDIDECQLESTSSPCNASTEYCVNSIGSYICTCKGDFTYISGEYAELNTTNLVGIIITLGTIMTISLLVNVFLVVSRLKSAKSSNPGRGTISSDFQLSSKNVLEQYENNYADASDPVGQSSVYEQIIPQKRQIVQDTNSEYAALTHDDEY